jgi:hypothetical protein
MNSDYILKQHQPTDRCHGDGFFLRGSDLIVNHHFDELLASRLMHINTEDSYRIRMPQCYLVLR